jgi:hypothetical protein
MSAKRRRSKRVSKSERVMVSITDPSPVQDVVVTLEVSQHGAKVLARRHFVTDSRGTAMFIATGREVPCRVAWQRAPGAEGRMETGLEIYANGNFWGLDLEGSELEPELLPHALTAAAPKAAAGKVAASSVATMVDALGSKNAATLSIELWCALVDNLEAKGVFTRAELAAMLRKLQEPKG